MIIKIKLTLGGLRNPCIVTVSSTPETPLAVTVTKTDTLVASSNDSAISNNCVTVDEIPESKQRVLINIIGECVK